MPSYQVIAPGFMHGQGYHPNGPRNVCETDEPLKEIPSWLKKMSDSEVKDARAPETKDKDDGPLGFFKKATTEQGKSVDL